jgi:hypothetical protein
VKYSLRIILRQLASSDCAFAEQFLRAAQLYLLQVASKHPAPNSLLLAPSPSDPNTNNSDNQHDTRTSYQPAPLLCRLASRVQMLYSSGLLREAIQAIICILQTSLCPGVRWSDGCDLAELYNRIDEDIVCVINIAIKNVQGLKQAIRAPQMPTRGTRKLARTGKVARRHVDEESAEDYLDLLVELGTELQKIQVAVAAWNGQFPFPKGTAALAVASNFGFGEKKKQLEGALGELTLAPSPP